MNVLLRIFANRWEILAVVSDAEYLSFIIVGVLASHTAVNVLCNLEIGFFFYDTCFHKIYDVCYYWHFDRVKICEHGPDSSLVFFYLSDL